ncbi:MAG: hypothetical protein QXV08_07180, partial [Desulfurococcus sp.]|uniref:hypothetical protein n=1 Tax=Desulfurococcus sp. TaxID=51678 RepID=UPI00317069F0
RSFSVVFNDGRSVLIYEGKVAEAGFPVEAVAFANNIILAKITGGTLIILAVILISHIHTGSQKSST